MKLSIIIPIYKVEPYIEKCLLSCVNQENVQLGIEYEIICVNDGTPDNSAEIARGIAAQYNGISVINQENQGLSGARNTGIEAAQGEYVWFIDSDDTIKENCLDDIFNKLREDLDVLYIQKMDVYEDGRISKPKPMCIVDAITTGLELLKAGRFQTMAQLSIYRKALLDVHKLRFFPGILHEDAEFMPRVLYFAQKIMSHDKYVYNYLLRTTGSITAQYKLKNALDSFVVCNSLFNFSKGLEDMAIEAFSDRISQIVYTHIFRFKYLNKEEQGFVLKKMKEYRYIYSYMMKSKSPKNKVAGLLLYTNARIGILCFNAVFRG